MQIGSKCSPLGGGGATTNVANSKQESKIVPIVSCCSTESEKEEMIKVNSSRSTFISRKKYVYLRMNKFHSRTWNAAGNNTNPLHQPCSQALRITSLRMHIMHLMHIASSVNNDFFYSSGINSRPCRSIVMLSTR